MIALIDGDILVYRVGFASENQTEAQNCMNTELVMEQILRDNETEDYKVYLTGKGIENNYRYKIDPTYKANRKDARKPRWYESIRMFLVNEFNAETTDGQEADDALGIGQSSLIPHWDSSEVYKSVICSIDKDLLQIPGKHYNITTRKHQEVDVIDGLRNFYSQLLIGDRVDNVRGVDGLGIVKTERILRGLAQESEMFERVRLLYQDDARLLKNGQLLWVRRKNDEIWSFPTETSLLQEVEDVPTDTPSSLGLTSSQTDSDLTKSSQEQLQDPIQSDSIGPETTDSQ